MMHKGMLLMSALALVATLTVATPASAQDNELQGFSVSAGVFYPTKSAVRKATDDVWLNVNLGYTFQTSEPNESGYYYDLGVMVGYYGSGDIYNIPVMATFTGYINPQFFYRAGAGVGFTKQFRTGLAGATKNESNFAYMIELGYNFSAGTTPIAITVGYQGVSGANDQFTGLTFNLHFRF